jgi:hypothetical protein
MFEIIFLVSFLLIQDVGGVSISNTEMHQQDEGHSGISTFLALSLHHVTVVNQSSCWVCTYAPFTSWAGIPLRVIPFEPFNRVKCWVYGDVNWYKAIVWTNLK